MATYRNHVPDCCVAIEDDRTLVDPDPDTDVEEKVVLFTVEGVVMP